MRDTGDSQLPDISLFLIFEDQIRILSLIIIEIRLRKIVRSDGSVVPALRVKIRLQSGIFEPASTPRTDFIPGNPKLLTIKASQVIDCKIPGIT